MEIREENYPAQTFSNSNLQVKDIEEQQRILKDRLILIGNNLIENKVKTTNENIEIKKQIEILNQEIKKIKSFMEILSNEIPKFAKKQDIEILTKQAKIFQL